MTDTEQESGSKRLLPVRARAPLLITLVTVAVVGAAYYAYYRSKRTTTPAAIFGSVDADRADRGAGSRCSPASSARRGMPTWGMRQVLCRPPNRGDASAARSWNRKRDGSVVLQPKEGEKCFAISRLRLRPVFATAASARHSTLVVRAR